MTDIHREITNTSILSEDYNGSRGFLTAMLPESENILKNENRNWNVAVHFGHSGINHLLFDIN